MRGREKSHPPCSQKFSDDFQPENLIVGQDKDFRHRKILSLFPHGVGAHPS
jgi:hypothetical protein